MKIRIISYVALLLFCCANFAHADMRKYADAGGVEFLHTDNIYLVDDEEFPDIADWPLIQSHVPIRFTFHYPGYGAFTENLLYNLHDIPQPGVRGILSVLRNFELSKRLFYIGVNKNVAEDDFVDNIIANRFYAMGLYLLLEREGVDSMKSDLPGVIWEDDEYSLLQFGELLGDMGAQIDALRVDPNRQASLKRYLDNLSDEPEVNERHKLSIRVYDEYCSRDAECLVDTTGVILRQYITRNS